MGTAKIAAWLLIVLALVLIVHCSMAEISGKVDARTWRSKYTAQGPLLVFREETPQAFRSILAYRWIGASVSMGVGLMILVIVRRAERSDLIF